MMNAEHGRAARYLARANLEIVKAAAARRQRIGQGSGARLPPALAGRPVALTEIAAPRPDRSAPERITPLGYQTAKRTLPHVLAHLAPSDLRRQAADMLAGAVERVGSVKGLDLAGADGKGALSDGGATTRVKHAARLRLIEAAANGWGVDPRHGVRRARERTVLRIRRQRGHRQEIKAFAALVAVCVDGADLSAILQAHGWKPRAEHIKALRSGVLACLDDVAQALGLGRAEPKKSLDRNRQPET